MLLLANLANGAVTFECLLTGRYSTGADRKFALLEDLFKKFPSMPVSVEIKENNSELIKKVKIRCNINWAFRPARLL